MSDEAPAAPAQITPGVARALSPLVRRIVAPNPGIMTGQGTNTYLVGIDEIAVIDPGPDDKSHLDAIAGCGGDRIRWILATHTHPDHGPGAAGLKKRTGAEIVAFDSRDGLEADTTIGDGDRVVGTEFRLTAVHTPGHASNHLCYLLEEERTLVSGDHVLEGSTTVIRPPDGDMAAYLDSLAKVRTLKARQFAPGHGFLIEEPVATVDAYVQHRQEREEAILTAVSDGTATIPEIVKLVYTDVDEDRHTIAEHTVWAHLRKLVDEKKVKASDVDDPDSEWAAR